MLIALIDDHPEILDSLAGFLRGLGHQTVGFTDPVLALQAIPVQRPGLVLCDLRMPGMDGLAVLAAVAALPQPRPPIALMTAFADAATAVEGMRRGAIDYLRKPIDVRELHLLVERLAPVPVPSLPLRVDGLVVGGPAMAAAVALADRLHAAPGVPCLIEAETGCGKELIARRIHHGGVVADRRPFVAINCAAIPPGLFEAELFGYAPGSFTGGRPEGAPGKFALAGDGTLFLDEIGELPLDQQAKLLRVIEDRAWYPVGASRLHRFAARIVCATNRPLPDLVDSGRFREDLLYRLKVGHLRIPPLRERREEILPIATALLADIRRSLGRGPVGISPAAGAQLAAAPWPGNVRQLRHVLEMAAIGEDRDAGVLEPHQLQRHLTETLRRPTPTPTPPATPIPPPTPVTDEPGTAPLFTLPSEGFPLDAWQRRIVTAALDRHDGSPGRTAAYLGISRKVLYTLRRRYGLLATGEVEGEAGDEE